MNSGFPKMFAKAVWLAEIEGMGCNLHNRGGRIAFLNLSPRPQSGNKWEKHLAKVQSSEF